MRGAVDAAASNVSLSSSGREGVGEVDDLKRLVSLVEEGESAALRLEFAGWTC